MSKNLLRRLTGSIRRYSAPGDGAIPSSKQKYVPDRGTYPTGFVASSTHVGVKPSNTKFDDVAMVASTAPCNAAAVFTQNRFQAAPVVVSRDVLKKTKGQGVSSVVVNSGCANAVTGKGGVEDAVAMGTECGKCFDKSADTSLVMSTGVIGQRLPIRKILSGIPRAHDNLGDTHAHWMRAAKAICTTDTFPKLLSKSFSLPSAPGTTYRIAGMTKGAGMIHPNMATLLGIICTDAPIAAPLLHPLLTTAVSKSFNSISIDGDTSTNDTVTLLANGAAGGPEISIESSAGFSEFQAALTEFATELSQLVVRDGEGATKFVTIRVVGAQSEEGAKRVANSIAKSPLVKTALYGSDANWGRVLCATGYAEAAEDEVVPEETSVSFVPSDGSQELKLLVKGEPEQVDEARASEILAAEDLEILVRVGEGSGRKGESVMWTCDFSHEYVTINGDYRT